jgi:hypothetical protein
MSSSSLNSLTSLTLLIIHDGSNDAQPSTTQTIPEIAPNEFHDSKQYMQKFRANLTEI